MHDKKSYIYNHNYSKLYHSHYYYKISDFVLLECYNLYGGFYWHLNNYMIMCYFCEKYRKIPVVNFTSSTFINNSTLNFKKYRYLTYDLMLKSNLTISAFSTLLRENLSIEIFLSSKKCSLKTCSEMFDR